jgi:hypothetical protein
MVPPGGKLMFSLPMNHVGQAWHVEIPFRLGLKSNGTVRPPYSYLAFFWDDLPEAYRAQQSELSKPISPGSAQLHESGHADPLKPQ